MKKNNYLKIKLRVGLVMHYTLIFQLNYPNASVLSHT